VNRPGGVKFVCGCKEGFEGDGKTCAKKEFACGVRFVRPQDGVKEGTPWWGWGVLELQFFSDDACNTKVDVDDGVPIGSSWHEGADYYSPGAAMRWQGRHGQFGGRIDPKATDKIIWLGVKFKNAKRLKCARLRQEAGFQATKIRVETLSGSEWMQNKVVSGRDGWNSILFTMSCSGADGSTNKPTTPKPTTPKPTTEPNGQTGVQWMLGPPGQSCEDTCAADAKVCSEDALKQVQSAEQVSAAAREAGEKCTATRGWGVDSSPNICTSDPCVGICTYGAGESRSCSSADFSGFWTRLCPCAAATGTCTNTCHYANNGECDDGGSGSHYDDCELGTDCNDCGQRHRL